MERGNGLRRETAQERHDEVWPKFEIIHRRIFAGRAAGGNRRHSDRGGGGDAERGERSAHAAAAWHRYRLRVATAAHSHSRGGRQPILWAARGERPDQSHSVNRL